MTTVPSDVSIMSDEANFIQDVSKFYNVEDLSDITLVVGSTRYFAHKFVLAKSSDVFRTMLYEKDWSLGLKAEMELEELPECQLVFDTFLCYFYTAKVSITTSTAVGILCLADKYNVMTLKELCTQYMTLKSRSPQVGNALKWYSWAKLLHIEPLQRQCYRSIAWNYMDIMASPEWDTMDLEIVMDFLQSSELIVSNELAVWDAVRLWLTHESRVHQLRENADRLLPLVRFPQMQILQLHQLEKTELADGPQCGDILHRLLATACRFQAPRPVREQLAAFNDPFYEPRDYTDLIVDSIRIQNSFRFGIQVDLKKFCDPVPSKAHGTDWKVTCRPLAYWSLEMHCHETMPVNNETHVQPTIIMYNEDDNVIQVHREEKRECLRGSTITIQITMDYPDLTKTMSVLIKPVATIT